MDMWFEPGGASLIETKGSRAEKRKTGMLKREVTPKLQPLL